MSALRQQGSGTALVALLGPHLKEKCLTGRRKEARMRFDQFSFGTIRIDGSTCEHDVVIDRGEIRKRKKGPSKQFSQAFGHTPVSIEENIPWKCHRLVIGTGAYGKLPVMKEVKREAERRKVELVVLRLPKLLRCSMESQKQPMRSFTSPAEACPPAFFAPVPFARGDIKEAYA